MNSKSIETAPNADVVAPAEDIFLDLESPDADIPIAKIRLAAAINDILKKRNLSQMGAAAIPCMTRAKVSALQSYKLDRFSLMHLMTFANLLDYDVVLRFCPTAGAKPKGRVTVVA